MSDNNEQLKRNTFIKNAYENLLFTTLPTNRDEAEEFFKRLIVISRIESKRVVDDYVGFDFEKLKSESFDAYEDNVKFLKKYKNKLELTENIEGKLNENGYELDVYDFCKIYNSLYPGFLRVFDDYLSFDAESIKDSKRDVYNENVNYLNRYMERGGEVYTTAIKNNPEFKNNISKVECATDIELKANNKDSILAQRKLAHLLDTNLFIADGLDSRISAILSIIIEIVDSDDINESMISIVDKNMDSIISLFEEFQKYLNRIRFEIKNIRRISPDNYHVILTDVLTYTYFGAEWWLERFETLEQAEVDKHNMIAEYKGK